MYCEPAPQRRSKPTTNTEKLMNFIICIKQCFANIPLYLTAKGLKNAYPKLIVQLGIQQVLPLRLSVGYMIPGGDLLCLFP
ncbi:Uncharacterised protein [Zhongshania aliphaticivorans]|uniref:Uncharacterized protein n=1 Tax=Zhongshania aliphaticivorans TaxID=1470434 RepID=A0A5S9PWW6_9GAMM|nr:Uncharacterised protein [Zhongshania aliphaticivorans]CAA0109509.1 Uncharacterised protein [Zhongshania aliphaticivorans]